MMEKRTTGPSRADTRVVLVQLYSELQPPNAEPFSIEVLASTLQQYCEHCNVSLETVYPSMDKDASDRLVTLLSGDDVQLVGLSVPQGTYSLATQILSDLEQKASIGYRPTVVLGNALPTYVPEAFLPRFPWAVAVRGWGEDALVTLVRMLQSGNVEVGSIPGIHYLQGHQIVSTPLSLQLTPQPPMRIQAKRYFSRVETSRGCHYGMCTFCTRPPGQKTHWKRLPLGTVLDSVRELRAQRIDYFTFTDEDFLGNDLDGALAIATGIADIGGMNFSVSVRADNIVNPHGTLDENAKRLKVIEELNRAGLSLVFMGVESLSDTQLQRYGKGVKAADSIKAARVIKQLNIPLEVGFILFDPFVSVRELRENLDALESSGLWENASSIFSKLLVQKATPYEQWLKSKGVLGVLDVNMLAFDWDFQDSQSASIAAACLHWSASFQAVYRLLRNLQRTKQHNTATAFMKLFRKLDLEVLRYALDQKDGSSTSHDTIPSDQYYSRRYELAQGLWRQLEGSLGGAEEDLLQAELSRFLSSMPLY